MNCTLLSLLLSAKLFVFDAPVFEAAEMTATAQDVIYQCSMKLTNYK